VGFYIRKGFNFGPLRLNLSRSGLGASIGVKGARIGVGPRGSYVHLGRGGLYYRQTIAPPSPKVQPSQDAPPVTDELQEISSSAAQDIVDSSAAQLLQELNRIKRRIDLFPLSVIAGGVLLTRLAVSETAWWSWIAGLLAVAMIVIFARHNDVSDGTLILQYSIDGDAGQVFTHLQDAFKRFAACHRIWHVDAAAQTSDWKRNAGAGFLERRSEISAVFASPPKVQCNLDVPNIRAGRDTLYLLPDRLLIYDSSGVGAVPYMDLRAQSATTRFIETDQVPGDSVQVGTTWRYVAKNGGPDRRFNNNRQLPIMLYGELKLSSGSGLNAQFQCSVPDAAAELSSAIPPLASHSDSDKMAVSFASASQRQAFTRAGLWLSIVVMICTVLVPLVWDRATSAYQQTLQTQLAQQALQARQQFGQSLNHELLSRKVKNVLVTVADTKLELQVLNEPPKAARLDGLKPLDGERLFARLFPPNAEADLCALGFRTIQVSVDKDSSKELALACSSTRPFESRE
jgi:hypothetical protein